MSHEFCIEEMGEQIKAYKVAQKASGLKKGDFVLVTRKVESNFDGWRNTWVPPMDKYVGKVWSVDDVSADIILLHPEERYGFPFYVLQKVHRR